MNCLAIFNVLTKSSPVAITSSLLMIILPVIPSSRLSLLSSINLFFLAVSIFLVSLSLCSFSLSPLLGIFYLQLCYFLKCHCRFISIFLPNLRDYVFPSLFRAHAVLNFFFGWDLPHLHLRDRFRNLIFILLLCLRIFLNRFFVF